MKLFRSPLFFARTYSIQSVRIRVITNCYVIHKIAVNIGYKFWHGDCYRTGSEQVNAFLKRLRTSKGQENKRARGRKKNKGFTFKEDYFLWLSMMMLFQP